MSLLFCFFKKVKHVRDLKKKKKVPLQHPYLTKTKKPSSLDHTHFKYKSKYMYKYLKDLTDTDSSTALYP